jgi:hypothetical protein
MTSAPPTLNPESTVGIAAGITTRVTRWPSVAPMLRADHVLAPRAHVLGRQRRSRNPETRAQRDHQERDRKTDGHGRHCRRAQSPDPERIGQLVAGLQDIAQDDRDREPDQRGTDRPLEE